MSAGPEDVAGTKVAGGKSITGGAEHINGALAASKDDIADINAARQNALTIPTAKAFQTNEGIMSRVFGGKTTDGGY